MTFKQAVLQIVHSRKAVVENYALKLQAAIEANAELFALDKELRALAIAEAKGDKTAKKKSADLQKKLTELLAKSGISSAVPAPSCKKCNDTGFVKTDYCKCVINLALKDTNNIEISCTPFSKIDFKKFDKDFLERNKGIYDSAQEMCSLYPKNKRKIITLLGSTGTGKTLLAGACVAAFLSLGFSAVAVTAFGFVQRALKYHTIFDDTKNSFLEPLLAADLLVIDDLGTESTLKNVTHEYLFLVLSERLNAGKQTFITTNLDKEGILTRYGSRIFSRLFDKQLVFTDVLCGCDMRLR